MHDETTPLSAQTSTASSPAEAQSASPSASASLISCSAIFIAPDRQRKNPKEQKPLEELKRGIASKGLFHPIVLAPRAEPPPTEPSLQLVAGERRLHAIRELHQDGIAFTFNGDRVPAGHIPYTLLSALSPADIAEAELEENILRLQLPWQQEIEAKLKIHQLRKQQNPSQTLLDTAEEIIEKSGSDTSAKQERNVLSMAQVIAPYKNTPMVQKAGSLTKAYLQVIDHEKAKLARDLRKLAPAHSAHKIIHGDFFEQAKKLPEASFDLIISDPPYGISANLQSFVKTHAYDDSPESALALYREILVRGWKLLKPKGLVFLFCDIEHFKTIRTYADSMAYSTWRTPLIWQKDHDGPAPWGRNGFARTYELLFFASKGQAPLAHGPEPDIKCISRTNTKDRKHAAEKPPELLRYFLQLATHPGAKVLDPCAGSGPLLVAAKGMGLELTLIEQNEDYYNQLCARAQEVEGSATVPEDEVAFQQTLADLDDDIFGAKP